MTPYDNYCLVAIQGDCSAYGMGDTADFIPLKDRSFFTLIKSYLRNQLELDLKYVEMEVADLLKDQEFKEYYGTKNIRNLSDAKSILETFSVGI